MTTAIKHYEMYNLCVAPFCSNCTEIITVTSKETPIILTHWKETMDKTLSWRLNFEFCLRVTF